MTLSEARLRGSCGSGVYGIANRQTKSIYVGSTSSLVCRARCHVSLLRSNRHCNVNLSDSWLTYGERSHEFVVLQACRAKDDPRFLEQKWMDDFSSNGWKLMNLLSVKSLMPMKQHGKTVALSPDLHQEIRRVAAGRNESIGGLVAKVWESFKEDQGGRLYSHNLKLSEFKQI